MANDTVRDFTPGVSARLGSNGEIQFDFNDDVSYTLSSVIVSLDDYESVIVMAMGEDDDDMITEVIVFIIVIMLLIRKCLKISKFKNSITDRTRF